MGRLKNCLDNDVNGFYIYITYQEFRDKIHKEFEECFDDSYGVVIRGSEEEKNKINALLTLMFPDKTFYEGDAMKYASDKSFAIIDYRYLKICDGSLMDVLNSMFKLKHLNGTFYTIEDINCD
jgi:hypothetical protein